MLVAYTLTITFICIHLKYEIPVFPKMFIKIKEEAQTSMMNLWNCDE